MQPSINSTEKQGVTVLDLSGRIVAGEECNGVREKVKDLLASNQMKILLNLAEVTRSDSTGIGMLVEAVIVTAKEAGEFKLVNLPRVIYSTLFTHRLLQAFDIYDSEEKALASYRK